MTNDKIYNEVRFVMAENLRPDLLEQSPKKKGLVLLKVLVSSPPQYEILPVEGSPTKFIKKLGEEDRISQEVLNEGLKEAFEENKD